MGFIPEQQINELKDRIDIVDIISKYVDLKRAGSNFKGLCPFHNEKTPSFIVSREKNNFHCFGCHEGGDAISFIMKMENISYIEAIKFLADELGMILEETKYDKGKIEKNKKYFKINSLTGRYYFDNFRKNNFPKKYLQNRGIDLDTISNFYLGYAESDNGLYTHLKSKGIDDQDMLDLGLIGKSQNGGFYDKFRERLIFPILNNKNKVIGFGGRTLSDHKIKYLNSPESDIFIKGKNIYGVHIVNKTRNNKKIILVEGYMDVIGLYNQGIDYAVATLGTALTEEQAKLIKRYSDEIYIAYDGDSAGIKAALRAIEIFKNMNVQLGVLSFPDGLDPDEFINKYGKAKFEELLKNANDPIDFKLQKLAEKNISKMEQIKEIIEFLADIKGNVIRDLYIDKSSRFIGVSKDSLRRDVDIVIKKKEQRTNYKTDNFNNKVFGYNDNTVQLKKSEKLSEKNIQLQKEIVVQSIMGIKYYQQLKKYKENIVEEDLKILYSKISDLHDNNIKLEDLISSKEFKEKKLKEIYDHKKRNEENLPDIIYELEERMNKFILEKRKKELQEIISSGKGTSEVLSEYAEVIKKLT